MSVLAKGATALVLALLAVVAFSQSTTQSSPATQPAPAAPVQQKPAPHYVPRKTSHEVPCWKKAGIAPELVNERWTIQDKAKGKINSVCSDTTLTPEQKLSKIHQIDTETDGEIAQLIPAKQLEPYKSCQAERSKTHTPKPGEKELGPCGGVLPSSPNGPSHEHHMDSSHSSK